MCVCSAEGINSHILYGIQIPFKTNILLGLVPIELIIPLFGTDILAMFSYKQVLRRIC